jgi:hypothetical protein
MRVGGDNIFNSLKRAKTRRGVSLRETNVRVPV